MGRNEHRTDIPDVLNALFEKAKHGDVPAARKLLGWYDQGLGRPEQAQPKTASLDENTPYAERTPEERALLRGRLMQRIARGGASARGRRGRRRRGRHTPRLPLPRKLAGLLTEPLWTPPSQRAKGVVKGSASPFFGNPTESTRAGDGAKESCL